MIAPCLLTWVKQLAGLASKWIQRSNVDAFEAVALQTGQAKICVQITATMANRKNMIDMEIGRLFAFPNTAVFATITGPQANCAT